MTSNQTKDISINSLSFFEKIQRFYNYWNKETDTQFESFIFILGKVANGDSSQTKTCQLHLWLFEYEFTETIIILTKDRISVLASKPKKLLLDKMSIPSHYTGPPLEVTLKDSSISQATLFENFLGSVFPSDDPPPKGPKGYFADEQPQGEYVLEFKKYFEKQFPQVASKDCTNFFHEITMTKDSLEIESLRISGKFTEFVYKELLETVEKAIDEERYERHDVIGKNIERLLDDEEFMRKFIKHHPDYNVDIGFLEFGAPVVVQSGGCYDLRMQAGASNTPKVLKDDTVILAVCGKYKDICCNVSRTLLIDPEQEQKNAYQFLLDLFDVIVKNLKAGNQIKNAYQAVLQYVKDKGQEEHLKHLPSGFGYGIGMDPKEDLLAINANNERIIQKGMVFNVRLSLSKFDKLQRPEKNCLHFSDTVLVLEDMTEIITKNVLKELNDVSYSLEENQNDDIHETEQTKNRSANVGSGIYDQGRSVIQETRLRQPAPSNSTEEEIKIHQEELYQRKNEEIKQRYDEQRMNIGNLNSNTGKNLETITSYKSINDIPQELKRGEVYVDKARHVLLVPFIGPDGSKAHVPFHMLIIKNCSLSTEHSVTYLRINFHVPGSGVSSKELNFPVIKGPGQLFLKEFTLRSTNPMNLTLVCRQIREQIKQLKIEQNIQTKSAESKEEDQYLADEQLIINKAKKLSLDSVIIRPTIVGKKTLGTLETHTNGFRFVSNKNQKVDITFNNIKHAFFQPCKDDLIVLLHFRLKASIQIGNKKVVDVQFYTEICNLFDDLDARGNKRRMNDADELEQEKREIVYKQKLNDKFRKYCDTVQNMASENKYQIQFDIPWEELSFVGCHSKSSVKMMPTVNCLVSLGEMPFFVLDLDNVEIAHFERVTLQIKNFDLVFIYKDYQTFKRINSIPMECLDTIKSWLNSCDILFSEGPMPLNWTQILATARADIHDFVAQGGWSFLHDNKQDLSDDEDEGARAIGESDSEYREEEDEEVEEESDSDDSGDEDQDGESSDVQGDDDDSEGVSWDELEKQTLEQDRKQIESARGQVQAQRQNPNHHHGHHNTHSHDKSSRNGNSHNGHHRPSDKNNGQSRQMSSFNKVVSKQSMLHNQQKKRRQ